MMKSSYGIIGLALFLVFQTGFQPLLAVPQGKSPEDKVRETIRKFQKGVEAGDLTVGPTLATQGFSPYFVPFYRTFALGLGRAGLPFPVEIGVVKVLKDGRAKAEVYLSPGRNFFVFTLVQESGQWKFSEWEGIRFPLYTVPPLPASSVYQVPPDKVKWMMCERDVAFRACVFDRLKSALGPEEARKFFLDAEGFRVAMNAWLPFLEGAAQFALFYGILEENYYGSKYVITRAADDEAEIRFAPLQELEVMKIAVFFPKMSIEEYRDFYRAVMRERARVCGLDLEVSFDGTNCTLKLSRVKNK